VRIEPGVTINVYGGKAEGSDVRFVVKRVFWCLQTVGMSVGFVMFDSLTLPGLILRGLSLSFGK